LVLINSVTYISYYKRNGLILIGW